MRNKWVALVGKKVEWIHPGAGKAVLAKVVSIDVSASGKPVAINVAGEDFKDGASLGRLDKKGNLLS